MDVCIRFSTVWETGVEHKRSLAGQVRTACRLFMDHGSVLLRNRDRSGNSLHIIAMTVQNFIIALTPDLPLVSVGSAERDRKWSVLLRIANASSTLNVNLSRHKYKLIM